MEQDSPSGKPAQAIPSAEVDPGRVAAIVIGRNEGERLVRCLKSVPRDLGAMIYVDSGSTDDSVSSARMLGADVIELDPQTSFTAARARNEGFVRADQTLADMQAAMFIDGDCELSPDWFPVALHDLNAYPQCAAVAGRLRERFPEASIYNRLCDMEWHVPAGDVEACGGIALFRATAFREVGGFNAGVIAGEEPELCVRLRQRGWRIRRIEQEMAWHDAAMISFSQWWRRAVRSGHAYAEAVAMHGGEPDRSGVRETLSSVLYGAFLPVAIAAFAAAASSWFLLLLFVYPLLAFKIARNRRRSHGDSWRWSLLYGTACVIAKPAQCVGAVRYVFRRLLNRAPRIIEHKR